MKPLLIGTIALLTLSLAPAPAQANGICALEPEGVATPFPGYPLWYVKEKNHQIQGIVKWVPLYGTHAPGNGVWRFTGECSVLQLIEEVVACSWQFTTDCAGPYGLHLVPMTEADGELPLPAPTAPELRRLPPMPFSV